MPRPRVIVACPDSDALVHIESTLNPRRYRLERVFDLSEGWLRARLVRAHALIVRAEAKDSDRLAIWREESSGEPPPFRLVIIADDIAALEPISTALGAELVSGMHDGQAVARAVQRACTAVQRERELGRDPGSEPSRPRVLLLVPDSLMAEALSAVLSDELSVHCVHAATPEGAVAALADDTMECAVGDVRLLMTSHHGPALAAKLTRAAVPFFVLAAGYDEEISTAAQAAWQIIPKLRETLAGR